MDWFSNNEVLIQQIGVFAIAAAGLQLLLNSGVFSLHVAGTWLIGSYATAIGLREGLPPVGAYLAAIVIGATVSLVLAVLTRRLNGLALAMATLAFSLIAVIGIRSGGDFTGASLGLYGIPVTTSTTGVWVSAAVVAVLLGWLEQGRRRRTLSAMREDVQVAAAVGIPVVWTREAIMVLAGAITAYSGGLYASLFNAISPDQGGFPLVISLLTMAIVGGIGSWLGAYLGAALLTWLPTFSTLFNDWNAAITGAVMILVVVYAPGGLLGLVVAAFERIKGLAGWAGRRRSTATRSAG